MSFPKYPSKQQFISYMESYAAFFNIFPRFKSEVEAAWFDSAIGCWSVRLASGEQLLSRWLVVATGENAEPALPDIPVVGCGNSGMEVSLDLCRYNGRHHMVVHVLPREMLGMSTFVPVRAVGRVLVAVSNMTLGDTDSLGLRRPKMGPTKMKNLTGKTPVLDVGALGLIEVGKIKGGGLTVLLGIHTNPRLLPLHPMELHGRSILGCDFGGFEGKSQLPGLVDKCIEEAKKDSFILDKEEVVRKLRDGADEESRCGQTAVIRRDALPRAETSVHAMVTNMMRYGNPEAGHEHKILLNEAAGQSPQNSFKVTKRGSEGGGDREASPKKPKP